MGSFSMAEIFVQCSRIKYESLLEKKKRCVRKIKVLKSQNASLSRTIKRLQRRNTAIKKEIDDMVYEVCPHCDNEVGLRWNVENDGMQIFCPSCGNKMMLCSMCDIGIDLGGECGFGYSDDSCHVEVKDEV